MSKNLAITVLTWNDWENTTKCLESIFQSSFENFDVILVDNNSDEIHLKKIHEWANNKIKIEDEELNLSLTFIISITGIPSVMQTINSISLSIASMILFAA